MSISLQRTYGRYSLRQIKKRARSGDQVASGLLKAISYGSSLRGVLWLMIGLFSAGFFVSVSTQYDYWIAIVASATLIWTGFVWLPAAKVSSLSEKLASWLAPMFGKFLSYTDPVLSRIVGFIHKIRPIHIHTGLYDRMDLIELLEKQQVQPDNKIEKFELDIAKHALQFGDIKIGERMIPRRKVKLVSYTESIGPVIIDELHNSGHSRFPVYEGSMDNLVGTLYLRDLVQVKHGGSIKNIMKPEVFYLHEDQSMYDALQAVIKTHHHLFMVVNSFEEFVGIISSEDILESIIGKTIFDEFDNYENLRSVAARDAAIEHEEHEDELNDATIEAGEEKNANIKAIDEDIETVEIDNTK